MAVSHIKTVTVANGTNTDIVRPSDWNAAHNQIWTLAGNTNNASVVSGTNVVLSGNNNVTLIGSGSTIGISAGASSATISAGTVSQTLGNLVLANSNNITFGLSPGGTVTASATVHASNVGIRQIGIEEDLAHMLSDAFSAGWIKGGEITDAGAGSINIALGEGFLRSADTTTATLYYVGWEALSGVSIPAGATRYIVVYYNGGNPVVQVNASAPPNNRQYIYLGEVHSHEGALLIHFDPRPAGDFAHRLIDWVSDAIGTLVAFGEEVSDPAPAFSESRNLKITAGKFWDHHFLSYTDADIDTSTTGDFEAHYRDGFGEYTNVLGQTQWDNTQYDDGSGTLATLTDNYYGNHWIARGFEGGLHLIYGVSQHADLDEALAAPFPERPEILDEHGFIVAQVTFQKGALGPVQITDRRPIIGRGAGGNGGGGGAGDGGNILAAGTQTAFSTGTVQFANSHGLSFGMASNSVITASHNALTALPVHASGGHSGNILPGVDQNLGQAALAIGTRTTAPSALADHVQLYAFAEQSKIRLGMVTPDGAQVTHAQDQFIIVRNTSGAPIAAGKAVFVTGSTGQTPNVSLALADSTATMPAVGITAEAIGINEFGRVMFGGIAANLNTLAFSEGDLLYVSASAAGDLTATEPSYPNLRQRIGVVINAHATQGKILILPSSVRGEFGVQAISAGTTAITSNGLQFADSNGLTWGLNGNTLTASHNGLSSQSNQAYSAANGSAAFQTLSFANSNGVSFSTGTQGLYATVKTDYLTTAALSDHSHGNPTLALTNLSGTTASNSAGLTLSLSVGAGGAGDGVNILAAGTQTANTTGTVLFSNSNGITFGMQNSSQITASHDGLTSQSNQALSGSNGSFTFQTATFGNLNGLSFYTSNGSLVGSYTVPVQSNQSGGVYAVGNTTGQSSSSTYDARSLSVDGAGIVSAGWSNGSLRVSATQSNQAASGSNGSFTFQTLSFGNLNGLSFYTSNGSVVGSYTDAGGAGAGFSAGMSNLGNTQGTSGTVASHLVLVGGNGITLSQSVNGNSATLSINSPEPESRWLNEPAITQVGTVMGNSLVSLVPLQIPYLLDATNLRFGGSISVATQTNNSSAFLDLSCSAVLYTRNVSTLSSIASGSNTYTGTWTSNATGTMTGPRGFTLGFGGSTRLPRGEYWLALHVSTTNTATGGANTTALGNSISMLIGATAGSAALGLDPFFNAVATSRGASIGLGVVSTGATRGTIGFDQITQTGTRGNVAKLWLDFRNYTVW